MLVGSKHYQNPDQSSSNSNQFKVSYLIKFDKGLDLQELSNTEEDTNLNVHHGSNLEYRDEEALCLLEYDINNTRTNVNVITGLPHVTYWRK